MKNLHLRITTIALVLFTFSCSIDEDLTTDTTIENQTEAELNLDAAKSSKIKGGVLNAAIGKNNQSAKHNEGLSTSKSNPNGNGDGTDGNDDDGTEGDPVIPDTNDLTEDENTIKSKELNLNNDQRADVHGRTRTKRPDNPGKFRTASGPSLPNNPVQ